MPDEDTLDVQRTMQAICRHLARHPVAADSASGIAMWWLPPLGVEVTLVVVQAALTQLATEGRVQCRVMPDGRAIYGAPGTAGACGTPRA